MRIGVDIDEVLAEFIPPFIDFHNREYGTALKREQFHTFNLWEVVDSSPQELKRVLDRFFLEGHFERIPPKSDAADAIGKLREEHELIIISARTAETHGMTRTWIERHFPGRFTNIIFSHNPYQDSRERTKGEWCRELHIDVMIEDDPRHAMACAACGIPVLLLDAPWNRCEMPSTIRRVHSWKEILETLPGFSRIRSNMTE